jgi:hypothetical protein
MRMRVCQTVKKPVKLQKFKFEILHYIQINLITPPKNKVLKQIAMFDIGNDVSM